MALPKVSERVANQGSVPFERVSKRSKGPQALWKTRASQREFCEITVLHEDLRREPFQVVRTGCWHAAHDSHLLFKTPWRSRVGKTITMSHRAVSNCGPPNS